MITRFWRYTVLAVFAFCAVLPARAQEEREMQWVNVTALHYAATGQKDKTNTLQQYLLIDEAVAEQHEDVVEDMKTFSTEFGQMVVNEIVPESLKEMEESLAQLKKMVQEHPEFADAYKEALKQFEESKKELQGMENPEASLSVDPAALLKRVTQIAVNKKAYTGFKDIGGGLYLVTEEPIYGSMSEDNFTWASQQGDTGFTWGAINYDGKVVIPFKYAYTRADFFDYDIIFLETQVGGKVRAGACGYDGRVRIPFEYDEYRGFCSLENDTAVFIKGDKLGWLSLDGKIKQPFEYTHAEEIGGGWMVSKDDRNYGIIIPDGTLAIPLKYKGFWSWNDGPLMWRHDGKLDVYDEDYKFVRTDPEPKID